MAHGMTEPPPSNFTCGVTLEPMRCCGKFLSGNEHYFDLQVAATPCDAWRISRIIPTFSDTAVPEQSFNQSIVGGMDTVSVTLKDLSAPHQLYVPEYGGQIYIFIGVASAVLVGAGTIGLLVSWAVILWNTRVYSGEAAPWWAYTANRWACHLHIQSVHLQHTCTTPAIPP